MPELSSVAYRGGADLYRSQNFEVKDPTLDMCGTASSAFNENQTNAVINGLSVGGSQS
jgi:hypothetical protein